MRIYDPRVGRFLSVDLLTKQYPHYTPYSFAGNKPTVFIDRDGEEEGLNIAMKRWETAYLNNKMSEKEYRENVKAMGTNGAVASFVTLDAYFTGGRVSTFLLMSQVAGHLYHNKSPDPKEEERRKNEVATDIIQLGGVWGTSRIIGGALNFFKGVTKEEVKYLFRGTSEGFGGTPALQRVQMTPTSSDPVVATIFSITSKKFGGGILQIGLPKNFQGVEFSGNVLQAMEKEIAVGVKPSEFTSRATTTITSDQARGILNDMGIKLPTSITNENMNDVLDVPVNVVLPHFWWLCLCQQ